MSGAGGLPHGESSCAIPLDQWSDREKDSVLPLEAILRRTSRFSGHGALFLRTTPAAVARNPFRNERISEEVTRHRDDKRSR